MPTGRPTSALIAVKPFGAAAFYDAGNASEGGMTLSQAQIVELSECIARRLASLEDEIACRLGEKGAPLPRLGEMTGHGAAAGQTLLGDIDLTEALALPGRHNAQNAAFAYASARAVGVSHEQAVAGLLSFPGLAHRMEPAAEMDGVRFINDSKATNADAARQALSSYERVFWIAGGRAKAGGIDSLADLFPRIARAYLIGEAAPDFARALGDTPHVVSATMEAAVQAAAADAAAEGGPAVVLLSPAAASFDQYPDFEARGEAFRAAVLAQISAKAP